MAFHIYNPERKVVSAIRVVILAMFLSLIAIWLLGGGINKIITLANSFHVATFSDLLKPGNSWAAFKLPWQLDTPQIDAGVVAVPEGGSGSISSNDGSTGPTRAFANASPYAGEVTISPVAAQTQSASGQYVELHASNLRTPADVSGWKLQSSLTGAEAVIPQAAPLFHQGQLNTVGNVRLAPGGSLIVSTGVSPVGVSFAENMCTGYLGTAQSFVPFLSQQCPSPQSAIADTPENEVRLGSGCFAYLSSLPSCTFPSHPPGSLSVACQTELQTKLSYNNCVAAHQSEANFKTGSWRIFLGRTAPLWQSDHDVIRLLDAQGRIVDMITY